MRKVVLYAWLLLSASLLLPSCELFEGPKKVTVSEEVKLVNNWIASTMYSYYYWNDRMIMTMDPNQVSDPYLYFSSLVYAGDRWSNLIKDYDSFVEELNGVSTTMGYDPGFGLAQAGSDQVMIIVNFVYKNSPAAKAGLKRGDVITLIDGEKMNTSNYYTLYSKSAYTATLRSGGTITMASEKMELDPVVTTSTFNVDGTKVGYLCYAQFSVGENEVWLNSLGAALSQFETAGVKDLILDFRYNPGGDIDAATYLASALVPKVNSDNGDVLIKLDYNAAYTAYLEAVMDTSDMDFFRENLQPSQRNLNLERVYVLTTSGTASASELVIVGLKPYMQVTTIGTTTHGKYMGAYVLPDMEERHNYALSLIAMRYANANNFTDFGGGLVPDFIVADTYEYPLGDENDPLIAQAISLVSGGAVTKKSAAKPLFEEMLPNPGKKHLETLFLGEIKH